VRHVYDTYDRGVSYLDAAPPTAGAGDGNGPALALALIGGTHSSPTLSIIYPEWELGQ